MKSFTCFLVMLACAWWMVSSDTEPQFQRAAAGFLLSIIGIIVFAPREKP